MTASIHVIGRVTLLSTDRFHFRDQLLPVRTPRTLEFDIAGFDLKGGEGKGLGINWKIYLVIDCQERGRFVHKRNLASFRCKEKSNLRVCTIHA